MKPVQRQTVDRAVADIVATAAAVHGRTTAGKQVVQMRSPGRLWCAITTSVLMRRPFLTSTRGAIRPTRLCDALGGPAEAGVDARRGAVMDCAGPVYPAPGSYERG